MQKEEIQINEMIVDGFSFEDKDEFVKAEKEYFIIKQIQDNMNLDLGKNAKKVYQKSLQKDTFHTVVGFSFLKQLQDTFQSNPVTKEQELKFIFVPGAKNSSYAGRLMEEKTEKMRYEVEKMKKRSLLYKIIIGFLASLIAVLFFLALTNNNMTYFNEKNKVLDKYSAWEEELKQKEKDLQKREEKLQTEEAR